MQWSETKKLAEELSKKYEVTIDPFKSTFHHSVLEFYSEAGFITDKQLQRLKRPLFPLRDRTGFANRQDNANDFERQYNHDFEGAFLY